MCLLSAGHGTDLLKDSIYLLSNLSRHQRHNKWLKAGMEIKVLPPFFFIKLISRLDPNLIARARTKGKLILNLNKENLNGA